MKYIKSTLKLMLVVLLVLMFGNFTGGNFIEGGFAEAATASGQIKKVMTKEVSGRLILYNKESNRRITGLTGIHELPKGSGNYYYFRSGRGWVYAKTWFRKNGKLYYANRKGKLLSGMAKVAGKYYYFDPKTHVIRTGWQEIGKKRYYFRSNGTRHTGWLLLNGAKYYLDPKNGYMRNGWVKDQGKLYFMSFNEAIYGQALTGWRTISSKQYYFRDSGEAYTGWMIAGQSCLFFDEEGVYHPEKSANSSRYSDATGTAKEKTMRRAEAIAASITNERMTKEQKLWTCFQYVMNTYTGRRPRTPHYCGTDWPEVYANDMFLDGSGNCFSYAAAFGYLAKAVGYENVYCCNSTGHGWTEIDGLVYDPEEYRNTSRKLYGTSYSQVPNYRAVLSWGYSFVHVRL